MTPPRLLSTSRGGRPSPAVPRLHRHRGIAFRATARRQLRPAPCPNAACRLPRRRPVPSAGPSRPRLPCLVQAQGNATPRSTQPPRTRPRMKRLHRRPQAQRPQHRARNCRPRLGSLGPSLAPSHLPLPPPPKPLPLHPARRRSPRTSAAGRRPCQAQDTAPSQPQQRAPLPPLHAAPLPTRSRPHGCHPAGPTIPPPPLLGALIPAASRRHPLRLQPPRGSPAPGGPPSSPSQPLRRPRPLPPRHTRALPRPWRS
jgi:hypothetical protein